MKTWIIYIAAAFAELAGCFAFWAWLRNGRWQAPSDPPPTWPAWPGWFEGPEDFPRLTEGLVAVGLDDDAIRGVLGENWLRLFDEVFPGSPGD